MPDAMVSMIAEVKAVYRGLGGFPERLLGPIVDGEGKVVTEAWLHRFADWLTSVDSRTQYLLQMHNDAKPMLSAPDYGLVTEGLPEEVRSFALHKARRLRQALADLESREGPLRKGYRTNEGIEAVDLLIGALSESAA